MSLEKMLGEELYKQVTEKLGDKKINITSDGNWIPKEKFDELNNEKKHYKELYDNTTTELNGFKEKAQSSEEFQTKITELQSKNDDLNKDWETKFNEMKKKTAVEKVLMKNNFKDNYTDYLINQIGLDKVELDDKGQPKEFDKTIEGLKENYSAMLNEDPKPPAGGGDFKGGNSKSEITDADRRAFGL